MALTLGHAQVTAAKSLIHPAPPSSSLEPPIPPQPPLPTSSDPDPFPNTDPATPRLLASQPSPSVSKFGQSFPKMAGGRGLRLQAAKCARGPEGQPAEGLCTPPATVLVC